MKAYFAAMAVLAVILAAFTVAGPAFAGQTQAEREWSLRHKADPESVVGWQVRPPVETGSLPVGGAQPLKPGTVEKGTFPTVEVGGVTYRIGIDTY